MKLSSIHALYGHLDKIDNDHILPIYAISTNNDAEKQLAYNAFLKIHSPEYDIRRISATEPHSIAQFHEELLSFNLFGKKSIFLIQDIDQLTSKIQKTILTDILSNQAHIFVLFSSKPLPKSIISTIEQKGLVVDIPPIKPWKKNEVTTQFIVQESKRRKIHLQSNLIPLLITLYGHDYTLLSSELEKLSIYSNNSKQITKDVILSLSPQKRQPDLFLLINALFERKPAQTIWKLYTALTEFSPISLIRLIRSRAILYAEIQSHISSISGNALKELFPQINDHRLRTIQQHLTYWKSYQLQRIISECDLIEQKLKTFSIDNNFLIELLLTTIIEPNSIQTNPIP